MSILRVATGPADIPSLGYDYVTQNFDSTRVAGSFAIGYQQGFSVRHDEVASDTTWYHFRLARRAFHSGVNALIAQEIFKVFDAAADELLTVSTYYGRLIFTVNGDTDVTGGETQLAEDAPYSVDIKIVVGANITMSFYVNSGLIETLTSANTGAKGDPVNIEFYNGADGGTAYVSELMVADEDTRGMRIRELRPQAFGVFQEWDGSAVGIRDDDLATGVTTALADARVSFGLNRIKFINSEDIINRVVIQTYAQRGETGIPSFNHFFRFPDGSVEDSATDIDVAEVGAWYLEEFTTNPDTSAAWEPEDFEGIQTGIRARDP